MDDIVGKFNKQQKVQELLKLQKRDTAIRDLSIDLAAVSSTVHEHIQPHQRSQSRSRDRRARNITPDIEILATGDNQQPPPDGGAPPITISTTNKKYSD